MAVTSIWYVSNRVDDVVKYVVNPDKTMEKPELSPEAIAARKAVGDVINYASNADKTEQMMYVTGINCNPDTAADQFLETKLYWDKTGGRLAYHGYQSFLEGAHFIVQYSSDSFLNKYLLHRLSQLGKVRILPPPGKTPNDERNFSVADATQKERKND